MPLDILGLVYASTAVVVTAAIGSTLTVIDEWYRKRKTILTPPDFVFPIAWTTIFALIGYSLYLAFVSEAPLTVHLAYILNLVLNVLWSLIFFKLHQPFIALGEIVLLWGSIYLAMDLVKPYSKLAGQLLIPYLAWVGFAALLNFLVVLKDGKIKSKRRFMGTKI